MRRPEDDLGFTETSVAAEIRLQSVDVNDALPLSVIERHSKYGALGTRYSVPGAQDVERSRRACDEVQDASSVGEALRETSKIALVLLDHAFDDIGDAASPRLVRVAP
jgi:hypothetical protein